MKNHQDCTKDSKNQPCKVLSMVYPSLPTHTSPCTHGHVYEHLEQLKGVNHINPGDKATSRSSSGELLIPPHRSSSHHTSYPLRRKKKTPFNMIGNSVDPTFYMSPAFNSFEQQSWVSHKPEDFLGWRPSQSEVSLFLWKGEYRSKIFISF